MRNFKWKAPYCVCMALLIVWLLAADIIIVKLMKADSISKCRDQIPEISNNMLNYRIGRIEASNDLLERVLVVGWAFGNVAQEPSEREAVIYLKGDDHCYQMKFENPEDEQLYKLYVVRTDVINAFPQLNLRGRELGFIGTFSTVGVRDGLYEMFLYCRESKEYASLVDTGVWVEKRGASLSKVEWESQASPPLTATSSETIKLMVDSTRETDGALEIRGWALKEGEDCGAQEVYLELTNREGAHLFYTTDGFSRAGVAKAFGDAKYEMSGFQAKFPLPELPDDEWAIRAWIKNGKNIWASNLYFFQTAKRLTQNYQPISKREVMSCVDSITASETEIKIQGWAFAKELDTANQRVFIAFSNAEKQLQFTARSWERPDVAAKYGSQYGKSGYVSYLPINDLPDGSWDMQLILKCGEEIVASEPYMVEKDGQNVNWTD